MKGFGRQVIAITKVMTQGDCRQQKMQSCHPAQLHKEIFGGPETFLNPVGAYPERL